MANRFIRGIDDGDITTEGELRSAFRAQALATHPDLGGGNDGSAAGNDFMRVRTEYEAAVRYLARPAGDPRGAPSRSAASAGFDRGLFYADLAILIKAGFPKRPRHDQERRKYSRLRLNLRSSLSRLAAETLADPLGAFDAFEAALFSLRDSGNDEATVIVDRVRSLLEDMIDYEACGLTPLRAAIAIEYSRLRVLLGTELGGSGEEALLAFLGALLEELDPRTIDARGVPYRAT